MLISFYLSSSACSNCAFLVASRSAIWPKRTLQITVRIQSWISIENFNNLLYSRKHTPILQQLRVVQLIRALIFVATFRLWPFQVVCVRSLPLLFLFPSLPFQARRQGLSFQLARRLVCVLLLVLVCLALRVFQYIFVYCFNGLIQRVQ